MGQRACQQYVLTEPFWLPVRVNIASISDSCCQSSFVPACQCNLAQPWVLFWHGFSAKPLAMISVRFSTHGLISYCVHLYWVEEMDSTKTNYTLLRMLIEIELITPGPGFVFVGGCHCDINSEIAFIWKHRCAWNLRTKHKYHGNGAPQN